MAIAAGSIVALKTTSGVLTTLGYQTAQPPVFGVSEGAEGSAVNWYNGTHVVAVAAGQLDEISNPNGTTLGLLGTVVNVPGYSAAFNGLVVAAYTRGATQQCVLVKTLTAGAFVELDATTVVPADNL